MTTDTETAAELAAALKPTHAGTAAAIELIRALADKGNAAIYIAEALRRAGIPTISGRGSWSHVQVKRLADKAGVTIKYRTA